MKWTNWLEVFANLASILTAVVAVLFTLNFWLLRHRNRLRVEDYLQKVWREERGARVPLRIAAELDMPVEEVRAALDGSRKVKTIPVQQAGSNRVDGLAYAYGRRRKSNKNTTDRRE